jgi:hypothetical protein
VGTVRSAARARNLPHRRALWLVLAVFALLCVLAARADAAPVVRTTSSGAGADGGDVDGEGDPAAATGELDVSVDGDLGTSWSAGPPDALVDPAAAADAARRAPSVRVAIAAAYRAAGLADDPAPTFARRSRMAALVPWIAVRVGQDDTWQDVVDPTVGHLFVYELRATWHFDRLAFDANEMRAHTLELARRRERRRVAMLVTRTYYTWLRARAAAVRTPAWALRAEQAAADLEAMTDGGWTARPPSANYENLPGTPEAAKL